MKRTIQAILCVLVFNSALAGRRLPDFDSLHSRVVSLDGGEERIGVYGLAGASNEELSARMGLNQRVDYFIQNGELFDGRLQVLESVEGREALFPPRRASLMYLRLLDIQDDITFWRNEDCLTFQQETIHQDSLINEIVYLIREQLGTFNNALLEENPFNCLMDSGIHGADNDFTDEEYRRMHAYFGRYVYFVEHVLNPWRDAWEGIDNPYVLLEETFWQRRLGDVAGFRFFAEEQLHPGTAGEQTLACLAEVDARINAMNQSPLSTLIALAIMDAGLNGMHGIWCSLRDALREMGNAGVEHYTEAVASAVLRRLEVLNALLVPEELLPIHGHHVNQEAFNRRVLELYRMLCDHIVRLYGHTREDTRGAVDWEAFEQTGQTIDGFIVEHFSLIAPLEIEDPEGSDLEDDAMELYSDDEEEIDYSDEDDGDGNAVAEEGEQQERFADSPSWFTPGDARAIVAASVLYLYDLQRHRDGGCG